MDKVFYEKVDLNKEYPSDPGKYIIFTESSIKVNNVFVKHDQSLEARFSGTNFDVSNQKPTHWLKRIEYLPVVIEKVVVEQTTRELLKTLFYRFIRKI
jgi:hypothetical protein